MAIDARELRIGNILHAEDDFLCMGCDVKIRSISEREVNWISITEVNKGTVQNDNIIDLEPILLTTEILLKCGFKYGKTGDKTDDSFVEFWDIRVDKHRHSFSNGFYFSIVRWWYSNIPKDFTFSHHEIRSDCKDVHQLQNLYYALTGKELEINL